MSASVTTTQACPCGQILRRAACKPLPRPHPGACVKGGIRTRFTVKKYPTSSPPASVEPRSSRQTELQKFCRGAVDAPHFANHRGSLCHRCPAHRLVPSGRPRALGHARFRASPGIRVSRSGLRRDVQTSRASDNKKPSGAFGSGGFAATGPISVRLCEIAPMSRACAIDWRGAIR
jgi:hypothetical protein